jgi:hypothetical protein
VKFNNPEYTGSGFRAHSTVQPHARLDIGDTTTIKNLALIDMFPNKDASMRKVLKIFKLAK